MTAVRWDARTLARAFGQTLDATEHLPPAEIAAYQTPLLHKLLLHARDHTDFYRDRLDAGLAAPERLRERWASIPTVTRADVVANRETLVSRAPPPEVGPTTEEVTSGSTGYPLRTARSALVEVGNQALTERMMRWWGVDGSKALARIAYDRANRALPPDGSRQFGWHGGHPKGLHLVLTHGADVATQLGWLLRNRPAYLATYSSILKELAAASLKAGSDLKFELVLSVGTTVDASAREASRAAFGAEIADTYGAQETGHLAAECPVCRQYHVSAETALVEVLRPDGSPAGPGETGRVVVTPLYNYAMPLIRYDIGDMAEVGSAQPTCGLGLPTLRRILGRYRNMFRFRDGTVLWPVVAHFRLDEFIRFKQSQVVQLDLDHVEVRYVPSTGEIPADIDALGAHMRTILRQNVHVTARAVETIQRSTTGKFEDCISLVPSG